MDARRSIPLPTPQPPRRGKWVELEVLYFLSMRRLCRPATRAGGCNLIIRGATSGGEGVLALGNWISTRMTMQCDATLRRMRKD
jgi:hypothetical protein